MRTLFRDRNFRLLLTGQTLSMFGDIALFLVLAIWVKELTSSNAEAGLVFLALALPALASPISGVFVDRFPRRRVMILNDLTTGLGVLALLFVHDRGDVWIIFAVAVFYGAAQQIFFAARSGLLVSMIPDEQLGSANSLLESLRQGLRIGGPLIGAGMFAVWGGGAVAVLDSSTFFVSAALLSMLRVRDLERATIRPSFIRELLAGARHIRSTRELRRAVAALAMAVTVAGMLEVALFALTDAGLHRPPTFIGVLGTIQGTGSIVGGLAAAPLMRRWGETAVLAGGLAALGASLGMLAVATLPVVVVALLLIGASLAAVLVAYMTLLQRRTTGELQGRVFSAAEAIITVPYTLSMGLGAALIAVISFRWIYAANAVGMILAGAWLARGSGRTIRDAAEVAAPRTDLSAGVLAPSEELLPPPKAGHG